MEIPSYHKLSKNVVKFNVIPNSHMSQIVRHKLSRKTDEPGLQQQDIYFSLRIVLSSKMLFGGSIKGSAFQFCNKLSQGYGGTSRSANSFVW